MDMSMGVVGVFFLVPMVCHEVLMDVLGGTAICVYAFVHRLQTAKSGLHVLIRKSAHPSPILDMLTLQV